jgi:hypothetical protein
LNEFFQIAMDLSKIPFAWEDRPQGVSWVDKLNSSQAISQCVHWNLEPALTLEANRVVLKNHIKSGTSIELNTNMRGHSSKTDTPTSESELQNVQAQHVEQEHLANTNSTIAAPQTGDWMAIVQATAAAIGENIATAIAGRRNQPERESGARPEPPRAFYDLVAALPICSGSDSHKLLEFLIGIQQIFELELADEKQMRVAILPKTNGQLRTIWASSITDGITRAGLMNKIAETFLPDRAKQQLIREAVYRVQKHNESLSDFITSVQSAAKILLQPNAELLDTILTGMNSANRACLAGFPAPTSVDELLHLVPRLEVIMKMDRSTPQAEPCSNNRQTQSSQYRAPWQGRYPRGNNYAPAHAHRYNNTERHNNVYSAGTPRAQFPYRPNTFSFGANRPNIRNYFPTLSQQPVRPPTPAHRLSDQQGNYRQGPQQQNQYYRSNSNRGR